MPTPTRGAFGRRLIGAAAYAMTRPLTGLSGTQTGPGTF